MPLPSWLARLNRRTINSVTRPFAGKLPGFAIVIHRGRRSGRLYRTPVNAFREGNNYLIALTYGAGTDWVRNVLAAGSAEMVTRGRRIALTQPRIVSDAGACTVPLVVRAMLGVIGVTQFLRLTRIPSAPRNAASIAGTTNESPGGSE
jgi:deazaflavin-dependent oxidoreductase (nitroreductase family)